MDIDSESVASGHRPHRGMILCKKKPISAGVIATTMLTIHPRRALPICWNWVTVVLSCSVLFLPPTKAFSSLTARISLRSATSPSAASATRLEGTHGSSGAGEEPDLFDYFDPLLSPHAYPNGISPDEKPLPAEDLPPSTVAKAKKQYANPFGIEYMSQKRTGSTEPLPSTEQSPSSNLVEEDQDSDDLFDYFDPLLSPHAYPNGISPRHKNNQKPEPLEEDERYNPLKMSSDVMTGGAGTKATEDSSLSPKKIGILLMDHGSRNSASNARLHHLAELYQLTMSSSSMSTTSQIIVKAAHMEIASPSIPDGLQALIDHGVDEIVCHPYFLSPGRHVMEDIPEIVSQAISDLSIDIPVVTTDPVGSNTQLMIGAIHSLVRENSQALRRQRSTN